MPEKRKQLTPDQVDLGERERVTQFVKTRHWTVITSKDLPWPVAISVARAGDELRCTGLVIGFSPEAPSAEPGEEGSVLPSITSGSLRRLAIPDLLAAIGHAGRFFSEPFRVPATAMPGVAGPDWDRADFEDATDDGGRTYLVGPIFGISGPRADRPFLDQLYPGMIPDAIEPAPKRRGPGRRLDHDHYVTVAEQHRIATRRGENREYVYAKPMDELARRLGIKFDPKKQPIPKPTVRRWVKRARDIGLLGPSRPGIAGDYPEDAEG
jgi:hypothetical protein